MANLVFHGKFEVEKVIVNSKIEPFKQMQVGDVFTASIPAFSWYLRSGKSPAVDVTIEYKGKEYILSGGYVASAANCFQLRQMLVV